MSREKAMGSRRLLAAVAGVVAAMCLAPRSQAASGTWTGAVDGNWDTTTANWTAIPGAVGVTNNGETATFNNNVNTSISIVANLNVKSITFDTASVGAFTLGGGPLLLTNGGTIQTTSTVASSETINAPLTLEGGYTFTSGATSSSATLSFGGDITNGATSSSALTIQGTNTGANTISGIISDGMLATTSLTKDQAGTWILSGANTFTGGVTAKAGLLQLSGAGTLGATKGSLNVSTSGAMLDLNGTSQMVGNFQGATGTSVFNNGSGTSTLTIGFANQGGGTYSGVIADNTNSGSGIVALKKIGTNTITLAGNNTYSGGTTVNGWYSNGGTLTSTLSASGTPFGSGSISLVGAKLALNPGATGATSLTGATASNATFSYAGGSILSLKQKDATSPLTFTIGDGATAPITRSGRGTLIIYQDGSASTLTGGAANMPSSLGVTNGDFLKVSGTAPSNTNGIVNPSIVTQVPAITYTNGLTNVTSLTTSPTVTSTMGALPATFGPGTTVLGKAVSAISGSAGNWTFTLTGNANAALTNASTNYATLAYFSFLNYDTTNGFQLPAYTTQNSSFAGTAGNVYSMTATAANQDISGSMYALQINPAPYAPRISGTVNIGGAAGQQAGVIFNGGVTTVNGGIINFGASEGIVWMRQSYGGNLGVTFAGTGGVTFAGDGGGHQNLPTNSTFSGGLTINAGDYNGNDTAGTAANSFDSEFGDPSNTVTFNGATFNSNLSGLPFGTNRALVVTAAGVNFQPDNHYFYYGGNMTAAGVLNLTSGNATLQTGGGTLTGNNTFSAGVVLSGSALPWRVASDANLGGSTSPISFQTNGMLGIMGNTVTSFGSHPVTLISGTALDIQSPTNTFTVSQSLNMGNNAFTKYGPGTVVLTGANLYTGGTMLYGGTVKVDASQGGSLAVTAPTFSGGILHLLGKSSGTTSTTLGNVTVGQAGGTLLVDTNTSSGTYNLTLGTMASSTSAGASLNIVTNTHGGGTANITTTTNKDASGIYSGRVTFNGADWATTASASGPYALSAYAGYTDVTTPSGTDALNSRMTDSQSIAGAWTTNSLKVTNTTTSQTLTLGGVVTLTSGGLLFSAANDEIITGGALAAGTGSNATNTDLIVSVDGGQAGKLTINSAIANGTGASTLTKAGTGTLILGNANTYTGNTFVNGGTLSISAINQLGATAGSSVYVDGGTLQITGSSGFTVATTHNLYFGSTNANASNGDGGAGTIDITNGGTVTVNANVAGGALTVNSSDASGGTLVMASTGSSQLNDGLNIGDSAKVRLGGTRNFNSLSAGEVTTYVTLGSGSQLQLGGFNAAIAGLVSSSSTAVVGNAFDTNNKAAATLTVSAGDNETFAGKLVDNATGNTGTGKLSIIKDGGGTWTLSNAASSYTGTTTIYNGAISVSSLGNAGSAGNLGAAANGAGALTAPIQIGYGASAGALYYTGSGETTDRNINLAGLAGGATLDASGSTSSASPLRFSGTIYATTSLGTAVAGAANKTLTLQGAGFGQLDGAVPDATVTAFNGQTGTGVTSLVKSGGGTWVLAGTNTYTGPTTITGGTLLINGSTAAASAVTVSAGTLGGSGTVGGNVMVASGAVLAPGASIAPLNVSGNATLGGTLKIELDGTGTGSADLLAVGGTLDITSATVDFSQLAPVDDAAYVFASYGSLTGSQFASVLNKPDGYQIDYSYGPSNDQIALVIPEPVGLGIMGLAGSALLLRRRSRKVA